MELPPLNCMECIINGSHSYSIKIPLPVYKIQNTTQCKVSLVSLVYVLVAVLKLRLPSKMIFGIFRLLVCCVKCAEEADERQAVEDQIRLAREAEIRRTNQLFRQERIQQQRCWRQQPGRIHAGTIVDVRGSMFSESKLKPQRAPPRSRARRRPAAVVDREDDDEGEDTSEFTPLM